MSLRSLLVTLTVIVCLFVVATANAQTGRFSGQVADTQGAAIPGATVQVINQDTQVKREAVTDASGNFSVAYLPAGLYQIIVKSGSFNTSIGNDVAVDVDQAVVYNVQLTIGSTSTEVTVEGGGATEINTHSAEVSGTVTSKEIATLALNGRVFTQLITMTPGVSNQSQQDEALVGAVGQSKYSFNGGRTEYNSFEVDGSDVLNLSIYPTAAPLIVTPSLDAIQEIKVLTSNYGAQYGRTASGVVIASTKSGTNAFHGNLYEYNRNEAFNARNYFDPVGKAPLYRRNDFGGTIGGPVFIPHLYNDAKTKTFFFFSEEARIDRTPTSYRVAAPSAAELTGDFSQFCPPPAGPGTYKQSDYPHCPLLDAQGNGSTIQGGSNAAFQFSEGDANLYAILGTGLIPAANATGGCSSSVNLCYVASVSPKTNWREDLFRIDHDISAKHRLTLRYIHDAWNTTVLSPQWGTLGSANTYPTVQNTFHGPGINALVSVSSAITSSLLNSAGFSYTDSKITLEPVAGPGANLARPAQLDATTPAAGYTTSKDGGDSLGYIFNNGFGGKIPGLVVTGLGSDLGGGNLLLDTGYAPWEHTSPTYNLTDNLTKTLGHHTLQAGTQVIWLERNQTNSAVGASTGDVQGLLTLTNTSSVNSTGGLLTGDAVASFQQDSAQGRFHQRAWIGEPYLQDDWNATPRLTINAGIRVSLFGNFYERSHQLYNWEASAFNSALSKSFFVDPSFGDLIDYGTGLSVPRTATNLDPRLTNGLVRCGYNGVPASCQSPKLWNPAPRVGFAWDVTGRGTSSLRAGYGMFFEHGTPYESNSGSLEANPPNVVTAETYSPLGGTACIGGKDPSFTCGGNVGAFPLSLTSIPSKTQWAYAQQWNLSYQQQLPHSLVTTIGYVGSRGTHLTAERQLNQLQPVPGALNPYGPHQPFQATDCGSNSINSAQTYTNNLAVACASSGLTSSSFRSPAAARVFAPGIDRIASIEPVASSSYHSFQFLGRRTKGPLTTDLAYTYSHSIDDSSDRNEIPVDGLNIQANKASSSFDQRHLFEVSYIYRLPLEALFRGARTTLMQPDIDTDEQSGGGSPKPPAHVKPVAPASGRIAHIILDNWDLSGLTLVQTGIPFSVYNAGSNGISTIDNAGVANGLSSLYTSYPDVVGSASKGITKARLAGGNNANSFGPLLLNPAAFAAPRGLTFGSAGRNVLNNPRRTNFDMSLLKHVSLPHESNLEFRAEAFNIFNHTQFRIFDPSQGNTPSNTISCYAGADANYSAGGTACYNGSSFLHPFNAHRARTGQLGLKLTF